MNDDVLFRREGAAGRITLNRPKALNALTLAMCEAMLGQMEEWGADPAIQAVLIEAAPGRAFCAGGDIRAIYESSLIRDGRAREFFTVEYRLNAAIRNFSKPYVALIDGIAMGGGLGVSVHGAYRVLSENAGLAMPETAIGLFPDIGASFFLSRLPGEIGMYLALTGLRLGPADALYAGLATHFAPATRFHEIAACLTAGERPESFLPSLAADPGIAPLRGHRLAIDRAFAGGSVEAIMAALMREGDWGRELAGLLATRSPSSLKLTFRLIREGAKLDFASCQRMEFRAVLGMIEHHDFLEGVRALLIEKGRKPNWNPDSLACVSESDTGNYFLPLQNGEFQA